MFFICFPNFCSCSLPENLIYFFVLQGVQSEEQGDRRAQPSGVQTSWNGVPTFGARGRPGYRGVIYERSEEQDHRRQPDQNQIPGKRTGINLGSEIYQVGNTFIVKPGSRQVFGVVIDQRNRVFRYVGGQNQTQPNGGGINHGASIIQINNTFITDEGAKYSSGSHRYQRGNVYPDTNVASEEKKQQNIESQAQLPNSSNLQSSPSYKKFYSLFVLFNWIVQLLSTEK